MSIAAPVTIPAATPNGYKDVGIAYILLIFLGVLGIHRFYIGTIGFGILYLLTGGLLGIGVLVDIFTLTTTVRKANAKIAAGI